MSQLSAQEWPFSIRVWASMETKQTQQWDEMGKKMPTSMFFSDAASLTAACNMMWNSSPPWTQMLTSAVVAVSQLSVSQPLARPGLHSYVTTCSFNICRKKPWHTSGFFLNTFLQLHFIQDKLLVSSFSSSNSYVRQLMSLLGSWLHGNKGRSITSMRAVRERKNCRRWNHVGRKTRRKRSVSRRKQRKGQTGHRWRRTTTGDCFCCCWQAERGRIWKQSPTERLLIASCMGWAVFLKLID